MTEEQQQAPIQQSIATTLPVPSPMVCRGNLSSNWEFFCQQWKDYEVATGLNNRDERIRLATFRSIMGRECLQILQNLSLTGEVTLKATEDALEAYFIPKKNIVYERYEFNTCNQQGEESIDSYVSRLRKLASTCKFGALTDELIRDRLILGLSNRSTQLRLLKEHELTLDKAIDVCRASEAAERQLKAIYDNKQPTSESVNVVKTKQFRRRQQSYHSPKTQSHSRKTITTTTNVANNNTTNHQVCTFCGNKRHSQRTDCPAFGQTCRKCKKQNHFAKVCMQQGSKRQVNKVEEEYDYDDDYDDNYDDNDDDDDDECELDISVIEEISAINEGSKRLKATLNVLTPDNYKEQLVCQLDTGATCNVISLKDLMIVLQDGDPQLEQTRVKLRVFDGGIIKPLGHTTLVIQEKGKQWPVKFQVVDVLSNPLLSAQTCTQLGLITVNVNPVEVIEQCEPQNKQPLTKELIAEKYKDVFEGLGHIGDSTITLNADAKPIQHTPRRIPVALKDKVQSKLNELEDRGIITKVTQPTEWISSTVVVTTPNKTRICLDPHDLNQAIQRPKYQMPTLEEVLARISKAKVFSTLDAKDGFYQIKLDEQSSLLTTFWTPFGRYRYLRMPFGISLAPEEFERKLHEHLDDLPGVIVLRDDILVVGNGETQAEADKDHDQNLGGLLERARQIKLRLNSNKMCLRQKEFMGHIITTEGLKPDPDKVKAVEEMPQPTNKKELQSLLGFVNYLTKFMPNLAEVTQPLRELTRKEARFIWAPQHDKAFQQVKSLVTQHPVLRFYDVNKEVTIQCDASERGLGATLLQEGQPVSFASRTLSNTERQYAPIEK